LNKQIDDVPFGPSKVWVGTSDDEERLTPSEDALESFAETADCTILSPFCA